MVRDVLFTAAVLALAAGAGAQVWPPRLVASFPAPPGALDIALGVFEDFILVDGSPPTIYELNGLGGSIINIFTVPVPRGARGLGYTPFNDQALWISNRINGYIYEIPRASLIISSFVCPAGKPYGFTYSDYSRHGEGLFAACPDENLIAKIDPATGSLLSSFRGPASAVIGFDYCLAIDRYSRFLYWDYYGSWQVLDKLPARPRGVAVGVEHRPYDEGICGFVLCADGFIYYYYGYITVGPASLGRVKALFR